MLFVTLLESPQNRYWGQPRILGPLPHNCAGSSPVRQKAGPQGDTLVCVGKHWEVSRQKKFLDLHVENVLLASKTQAAGEPAWMHHACAVVQGNHHIWGTMAIGVPNLELSRKELTHPQPEHRKRGHHMHQVLAHRHYGAAMFSH